jgi:hypothetical protein
MNESYKNKLNKIKKETSNYNEAVDAENKRTGDGFAKLLNPAITIPQRPCPPDQPFKWDAFELDLSASVAPTSTKKTAYLKNTLNSNLASDNWHTRSGFMTATFDTTVVANTKYAGHLFGRFGQGKDTVFAYGNTTIPFYWGVADVSIKPAMLVSFFPSTDAETGLAATSATIVMTAKALPWVSLERSAPQPNHLKLKFPRKDQELVLIILKFSLPH